MANNSETIIVNELLCYVKNHIKDLTKLTIVTIITGFYTKDEISAAKTIFNTYVDTFRTDSNLKYPLPEVVSRRSYDKIVEDIIDNWNTLEANQIQMPKYAALNLSRLPAAQSASESNTKVHAELMETSMADLRQEVNQALTGLQVKLDNLTKLYHDKSTTIQPPAPQPHIVPQTTATTSAVGLNIGLPTNNLPALSISTTPLSWADAAALQDDGASGRTGKDGFTLVGHKQRKFVSGKKKSSDSNLPGLKVIPRKITVFVSRLDKETTAESVEKYITNAGAQVSYCKKLAGISKTSGKAFNSAAFIVTCEAKYEAILYDEDTWPEDCLVREWVFKKFSPSSSSENAGSE